MEQLGDMVAGYWRDIQICISCVPVCTLSVFKVRQPSRHHRALALRQVMALHRRSGPGGV